MLQAQQKSQTEPNSRLPSLPRSLPEALDVIKLAWPIPERPRQL